MGRIILAVHVIDLQLGFVDCRLECHAYPCAPAPCLQKPEMTIMTIQRVSQGWIMRSHTWTVAEARGSSAKSSTRPKPTALRPLPGMAAPRWSSWQRENGRRRPESN